jgi:hypothetical protein
MAVVGLLDALAVVTQARPIPSLGSVVHGRQGAAGTAGGSFETVWVN